MKDHISIHSRKVWFTAADWQAFGDILAKTYPQARYFIDPTSRFRHGETKPDIIFHGTLLAPGTEGTPSLGVFMVFDPSWEPVVTKSWYNKEQEPDDWWWSLKATPPPFVLFRISTPMKPDRFPYRQDEIDFYADRRDESQIALRRQLFRLISKVATNRNVGFYRLPDWELLRVEKTGSFCWIGHDANRMSRQNPDLIIYPANGSDIAARIVEQT